MADSSEVWIEKATRGDERAVEELLVRYLPDLEAYVGRRAAHWLRERESASDLAQSVCREVLVRLRDGRFEFRGEPAFREWLYRAAVIKLVERARRGGAQQRDPAREVRDSGVLASLPAHTTPSAAALAHEQLERFHQAFASLDERSRDVLSLKLVDGASHAQIADRLGLSEAHSRVVLARALAHLAQRGVGA